MTRQTWWPENPFPPDYIVQAFANRQGLAEHCFEVMDIAWRERIVALAKEFAAGPTPDAETVWKRWQEFVEQLLKGSEIISAADVEALL